MPDAVEYLLRALTIGAGATAFMDLVAATRTGLFGTPSPDYSVVGRWLGYMTRGRFSHESIAAAPRLRNERLVGWSAHYAIGVVFAAALLSIAGINWSCHPTIGPALIVGLGTVAAPFLLMQPGMGAGIAASRTPRPNHARLRSFVTHATFGVGLYLAALVASSLKAFRC
jgi:Protein of unknown function (DUF2938)